MQIQINGKQVDMGEALRAHVSERLQEVAGKYAERAVDAAVTVSKDRYAFKADAKIHLSTGLVAQASATAPDVYAAFDSCAERLEKQLRRYKRRLKNHHAAERREPVEGLAATAYVLQAEQDEEESAPDGVEPVIVAETAMTIDALPVGEAVMRMELADAPFLIFRNPRHGGVNLVFRREDGHIGWIDPDMLGARKG